MARFNHERHKPPRPLERPRELVVACAAMRSNVNLSRIVRAASCCGVTRVMCTGQAKLITRIARDGADAIHIECHRSLPPVLKRFREQGFTLAGLEQATGSADLHDFRFPRRTLLVVGNERTGLDEPVLNLLDAVVEIPVWGLPHSYNVATAASMALYEYCRQYPHG